MPVNGRSNNRSKEVLPAKLQSRARSQRSPIYSHHPISKGSGIAARRMLHTTTSAAARRWLSSAEPLPTGSLRSALSSSETKAGTQSSDTTTACEANRPATRPKQSDSRRICSASLNNAREAGGIGQCRLSDQPLRFGHEPFGGSGRGRPHLNQQPAAGGQPLGCLG